MAQRRMFSPDIVSSEEFVTMPISSQALYFHLGMNADDDGFVQPKLVMRTLGANDDDLKVLLAKRFLLSFDGGVVVIKHWLIHNMIRGDRYKPTRFQDEKKLLKVKENKAYTELNKLGCQNDNQMAPQVRLGKVRLGKIENAVETTAPFIFKDYLKELENDKRRHINVIGHYFEVKGLKFDTREQANSALKRHLRASVEVAKFSDKEIVKATEQARQEYKDLYTIETIYKILTR